MEACRESYCCYFATSATRVASVATVASVASVASVANSKFKIQNFSFAFDFEFEAMKIYMSFRIFVFVWVIRTTKQVYKNAGIYLWEYNLAKNDFEAKSIVKVP